MEAPHRLLAEPPASRFLRLTAEILCPECRADFSPIEASKCNICGVVFHSPAGGDHTCGDCMKRRPHFTCLRSAGGYEGALMLLIHGLKYQGRLQVAKPLGDFLFCAYMDCTELHATDLVVPVPLHPSRARTRGFNQAALLLRKWPDWFEASGKGAPRLAYEEEILRRVVKTPAQTGLSRRERKRNIRRAFAVNPKKSVTGRCVLLVDDVATTGETLNECARTLKTAGAESVFALTLARAS